MNTHIMNLPCSIPLSYSRYVEPASTLQSCASNPNHACSIPYHHHSSYQKSSNLLLHPFHSPTSPNIDPPAPHRSARQHHAMRMKRRARHGRVAMTLQKMRNRIRRRNSRIQNIKRRPIHVKKIQRMRRGPRRENGCMFMHGQTSQRGPSCCCCSCSWRVDGAYRSHFVFPS